MGSPIVPRDVEQALRLTVEALDALTSDAETAVPLLERECLETEKRNRVVDIHLPCEMLIAGLIKRITEASDAA